MADNAPDPGIVISDTAPKLTPVDHDPFAASAAAPKLTPVDHDPFAKNVTSKKEDKSYNKNLEYEKKTSDFEKGEDVGFDKFGIGAAQLFSQMGTEDYNLGKIMPVIKDGKLTFGYPSREELAKKSKDIDARSEKLGIMGKAGEITADPTLLAGGEGKLGAVLARQAGVSSLLAPSGDAEQTLGGRTTRAGITSALAGVAPSAIGFAAPYAKKASGAVGDLAEKAVDKIAETDLGKNVQQQLAKLGPTAGKVLKEAGDAIAKGFSKPTGKLTDPSTLSATATALGVAFTGKETAKEVWEKISTALKDKTEELADKMTPGASTSEPWGLGHNVTISKAYGEAQKTNAQLYKQANTLGAKEFAPVEGLEIHLEDAIDYLQERVDGGEGSLNPKLISSLNSLKGVYSDIAAGGNVGKRTLWENAERVFGGGKEELVKITGDKLIELDQALNENFGRTGFEGKGGKALAQLQDQVQKTIKGMSPEFSQSYEKAKVDYINNIVHKFRDNPYLKNVWNEDDFRALQDMERGIKPSKEIAKRTEKLISGIKSYSDLAELREVAPDSYNSLRGVVFLDKMRDAGINPAKIEDKKTYALLLKSLEHDPQAVTTLDAIKSFMDEMRRAGIEKNPSPIELEEADTRKEQAMRSIFNYATNHTMSAIKHAFSALGGPVKTTTGERLTNFAGKISEGAPKPITTPGVIPNVAGRGITAALGGNSQ